MKSLNDYGLRSILSLKESEQLNKARYENMTKEKRNWKKIEGTGYWKPEEAGDELVGEVVGIEEGDYGNTYDIKTEDGNIMRTPSHAVLKNRMSSVEKGDYVRIVFTHVEAPTVKGYSATTMYDVFVDQK